MIPTDSLPPQMTPPQELLKALAVAWVNSPRATVQELSSAVGISKATFHRLCGTRENLVDFLETQGHLVLKRITNSWKFQSPPLVHAFDNLIQEHLKHRELLAYLIFIYKPGFSKAEKSSTWNSYIADLDSFFLQGQQAKIFRIDITAEVLTELFLNMIYGIIDAEHRGRAPSSTSAQSLKKIILHGTSALKVRLQHPISYNPKISLPKS